jgi:FkbM family methyltransferase
MNLIGFDYENAHDKQLCHDFLYDTSIKKYILGINKLTKSVQKHIQIDGIIDDFSRVQRSRKKSVLSIQDVPKESIILSTSTGSPLEVANTLDTQGYTHFNYLSFFRYSNLELAPPPFIMDFKEDFSNHRNEYQQTYDLLKDNTSKEIFTKVLNFKISFDLSFMQGFTNNHEAQYFDKELIPKKKEICFVDGGAYVGDTINPIIKHFPDVKKIICIEPNELHLNIAKRDFGHLPFIQFIHCGLSNQKTYSSQTEENLSLNCNHHYQATQTDTIDNLISQKVDYIKLDIEGAEENAIEGSKQAILKYHPILAICIYHKASDWYRIPQRVLEIRKDYDIYLRHYMEGIYETVMYFIPKKI